MQKEQNFSIFKNNEKVKKEFDNYRYELIA